MKSITSSNKVSDSKLDSLMNSTQKPQLYWQRWNVFFWFGLAVFINSIPGEIYVPIASDLQDIYNSSETIVTMASTVYVIMHPLLSIPSSHLIVKIGWASSVKLGVILTIVGSGIKLLVNSTGFYIIIIGQVLIGSGKPLILNAQATFAQSWFYPESRPSIFTILNILNTLSNIVTMLIPGKLIYRGYDLEKDMISSYSDGKDRLQYLQFILFYSSLAMLPCIVFMKNEPPTLPSKLGKKEIKSMNLSTTLVKLFKKIDFSLCLFTFSMFIGVTKAIIINMPYMFKVYGFQSSVVSVAGACAYVGGSLSQISVVVLISQVNSHKKLLITILLIGSSISIGLLYLLFQTENQYAVYASLGLIGYIFIPVIPLIMDSACDTVFPISPSFALAFLYIGSQISVASFGQIFSVTVGGSHTATNTRVLFTFILVLALQALGIFAFIFTKIKSVTRKMVTMSFQVGRSLLDQGQAMNSSILSKSSLFNLTSQLGVIGLIEVLQIEEQEQQDNKNYVTQSELSQQKQQNQ